MGAPWDRLFAVVGPSGAGKDTLLRLAVAIDPTLHLVRRAITRPPAAETEDFESVTSDAFEERRAAGEFALWWEAHGLHYGIPGRELASLAEGRTVLFNGSRGALRDAGRLFPGIGVVLVTAPDTLLAARLAARGREAADEVEARLDRARFSLPEGIKARVVVNDATPEEGARRLLSCLQPVSA